MVTTRHHAAPRRLGCPRSLSLVISLLVILTHNAAALDTETLLMKLRDGLVKIGAKSAPHNARLPFRLP